MRWVRRTANTAPSFCSLRTVKNVIFRVSLIFVSTSRRTSSLTEHSGKRRAVRRRQASASATKKAGKATHGSCSPALVKSARTWGSVAENRQVCLSSGMPFMTSLI